MAVSNYDPRWPEIWKDAALSSEGITLRGRSRSFCTTLRARLYRLRKEMQAEKHPNVELANKVTICAPFQVEGSVDPEKSWAITLRKSEAEYEDLLKDAGYDVPAAPNLD